MVGDPDSSSGNPRAKSVERESWAPFSYSELLSVPEFGFGVRERSQVRGTGDRPRPVLTDPVLFRLTLAERFSDGSLPELAGWAPLSC